MSAALSGLYVVSAAALLAALTLRREAMPASRLGRAAPRASASVLVRVGHLMRFRLSPLATQRASELELDDAASLALLRARKMLFATLGTAAGVLTGVPGAVVAAPLFGVAGFRLPDLHLARSVTARRHDVSLEVPRLLDVLSVSVSAGLAPRLALDRASETVGGVLSFELTRARRDVRLGASWRDALRAVADRTASRELRRLVVVLDRSDRLGTPVGERLRVLAEDVRSERRSRREERAQRAPVQMLFPLVFLILPAFVVAAVIPAILVATRGLS